MEGDLDDCEFWLPPQFLTDDDLLMDFKQSGNDGNKCLGLGAIGFNSGLSSPVESLVGSTETESDEDDYISGLTRRMAHSTLEDISYGYEANQVWALSGSPKSPLCSGLVGYGSSRCSQRSAPQVSSLPGFKQNDGAWDLLRAAAGEVSRMKMVEESAGFYPSRNGLILPPRKPGPMSVPLENTGLNQRRLSYQQLQAAWEFEQLKRQHTMKPHQQQGNGVWGQAKGGCGHWYQPNLNHQMTQSRGRRHVAADERPINLSMSSWPTLQQSQQQPQQPPTQPRSGMRAVFLGNPGAKRECAGTGVFLPRRIGSLTETRGNNKQPDLVILLFCSLVLMGVCMHFLVGLCTTACSTVLLPDRVVQALNLNLDAIDTQPQLHSRHNPNFAPDYDGALKYNKNMLRARQRQTTTSVRTPQPTVMNHHQEVRLPQEWTY